VQPAWTPTTITDGAVTWTTIYTPYDAIVTDNDLCLFDDELMISGLKWRFMKSAGLSYQDEQAEYQVLKDTAMARWQTGRKISFADSGIMLPITPNVPEGGYG
jgi:hypothetical protein